MEHLTTSVAMATYDGEKYLKIQLDSIARQTLPPDELIVQDDCSSDSTLSILEEFAKRASFRVLVEKNEINIGSTRSFERAIKRCTGSIIFLTDQDDIWREDKVSFIVSEFQKFPEAGLVFSDAVVVDDLERPLNYRLWKSWYFRRGDQRQFRSINSSLLLLLKRNVVTGATCAFRSAYLKRILPIPPGWFHDWWIALVISTSAKLIPISETLVFYRQHQVNQVGAPKRPLFAWYGRAFVIRELEAQISRLTMTKREMMSRVDGQNLFRFNTVVDAHMAHLATRRDVLVEGGSLSKLVREFIHLRYFHHSSGSGFKTFIFDTYARLIYKPISIGNRIKRPEDLEPPPA